MINEDVRHIIEPELEDGETLLWARKPEKFTLNSAALVFAVIIGLGAFVYNSSTPLTMNNIGAVCIVITLFVFYSTHPLTKTYALTDRRVIIKRWHPSMFSASIKNATILNVKRTGWLLGDGISIHTKSKLDGLEFLSGSNMSFTFGFGTWHWYYLLGLKDRDNTFDLFSAHLGQVKTL